MSMSKPKDIKELLSTMLLFLLINHSAKAQLSPLIQIQNATNPSNPSTESLITILQNNNYNQSFIESSSLFNCSLSQLYTYAQTPTQLANNTPYNIYISNVNLPLSVALTTLYRSITLTFVTTCNATTGNNCTITIENGCSQNIWNFNYFDRILLNIEDFHALTYNVLCDSQYIYGAFQYGNVLIIIFCTVLVAILPVFSRAWSVKGKGITINVWMIIGLCVAVIFLSIIGYFFMYALNIIGSILSWIVTVVCTGFCLNQVLYLTKNKYILASLMIYVVPIRVMDVISFIVGVGVASAWWFSNKNWIINDLVFVCFTVFVVKIFKFTSLKIAVVTFAIAVTLEFIAILLIYFIGGGSYNNVVLNEINFPFELQFPTINAVFNQKCAWLPITSAIFPAALFSYFRRFDSSRNTRLYLIIGIIVFILGSFVWVLISLVVPFSLPFGFVTEPAAMGLVSIFAYKRKEIRTLWTGYFYDEQFANMEGTKGVQQAIQFEKRPSDYSSMKGSILRGLQINYRQDSSIEPFNRNGINDSINGSL